MRFSDTQLEPFGKIVLDIIIETALSLKTALVYRAIKELTVCGMLRPGKEYPHIELVFDEALTNAMIHGNELDTSKTIRMRIFFQDTRWGAIIDDQGQGFAPDFVPPDELDEENLLTESGRGIALMDAYLDDLVYSPTGSSVLMTGTADQIDKDALIGAKESDDSASTGSVRVRMEPTHVVLYPEMDRISHDTIDVLNRWLLEYAEKTDTLVVNMMHVRFVSSVFIGVAVKYHRIMTAKSGKMILCELQEPVLGILKAVSMHKIFHIVDTEADAIQPR